MKEDYTHRKRPRSKCGSTSPDGESSPLPLLLRCPWCADGYLVRPTRETKLNNEYLNYNGNENSFFLCTNGAACPHWEVLGQDTSIGFSGMNGCELLNRFFVAFDAHLQICKGNSKTSSFSSGVEWSIVAERSLLFATLPTEFKKNPQEQKELEYEKANMNDKMQWLRRNINDPVFYFFVCEECDEKEFVC